MELPNILREQDYDSGINMFLHGLYTKMIPLIELLEKKPFLGDYTSEFADNLSLYQGKEARRNNAETLSDAVQVSRKVSSPEIDFSLKQNLDYVLEKANSALEKTDITQ